MKDIIIIIAIIILTAFAVFSFIDKRNSDAEVIILQGENEKILIEYKELTLTVDDLLERIEKINKTKEIIGKEYNEEASKVDDIDSRDSVIVILKRALAELGEEQYD